QVARELGVAGARAPALVARPRSPTHSWTQSALPGIIPALVARTIRPSPLTSGRWRCRGSGPGSRCAKTVYIGVKAVGDSVAEPLPTLIERSQRASLPGHPGRGIRRGLSPALAGRSMTTSCRPQDERDIAGARSRPSVRADADRRGPVLPSR